MKRLLLVAALALAAWDTNAQQNLSAAMRDYELEKYNSALAKFQQAAEADTSNLWAWYYAGVTALQLEQLNKAEEFFQRGMRANPNHPLNLAGLGQLQNRKQQLDAASATFAAVSQKSLGNRKFKDGEVYAVLAQALTDGDRKDTANAFAMESKALELAPKSPVALYAIGLMRKQIDDNGNAVKYFERAFTFDPKMAKAMWECGALFIDARNIELGKEYINKAIAADENFAPAYRELADVNFAQKDQASATSNFGRYLSMTEPTPKSMLKYASFQLLLGKNKEAMEEVYKTMAVDSTNIYVYRILGRSAYETAKYDTALYAYNKFFAGVNPAKIRYDDYLYLGKINLAKGLDADAQAAFNKAISVDSTKASELNKTLLDFFRANKNYGKEAEVLTNIIAKSAKKNPNDLFALGRAYYNQKDYVKADTVFAQLIELKPDYIPGHLYRARCNYSNQATAKSLFENMIAKIGSIEGGNDKYKRELKEAYTYLGSLAYNAKDKNAAKDYFGKVLAIDPNDATAKEAVANLAKMK